MKILVVTLGSIGDLMPFLAVAETLRARGHVVVFATNAGYAPVVRGAGFDFTAVWQRTGQALDDVLAHDPEAAWRRVQDQMFAPATQPTFDFIAHHARQAPCVVLANWSALGARLAHEKLGVPLCTAYLSPGAIRRDGAPIAASAHHRAIGFFPEWFGAPEPSWPDDIALTGFPMFEDALVPALPPALDDFLQRGPAPVIFTPGSFMRQASDFFRAALAACERLGLRAVLLSPYRDAVPTPLPATAIHFPYVSLQRLAPRAAALVSHGGIGTIAQGMAAGIPQLLTPVFFDQPDNAARLVSLGLGGIATPVTAEILTEKLRTILAAPTIHQSCRRVQGLMTDPRPQICALIEKMGRAGQGASPKPSFPQGTE